MLYNWSGVYVVELNIKLNSPVPWNVDSETGIVTPGVKSTDEVPGGTTIPQWKPLLTSPTPFVVPVVQPATIGLVTELVKFEKLDPER